MLAEQGLELQRELARGDRPAGRLGARQAVASVPLELDGSGAASTAARLVGAALVLLPDPATQPATKAMATTDAPSRTSRDTRLRVRSDSLTAQPPTLRNQNRPNDT